MAAAAHTATETATESGAAQPADGGTPPGDREELTLHEALELAVRYQQAHQFDAAETIYRRVLEALPDQADALHFLGVLLHQRGKSAEALEPLRRAIELQPEHALFHNNLGNVLFQMERFDEAAAAYERCLELSPADAGVYNNLGVVRRAQGRPDAAADAYRKAIDIDPKHADAFHNMGNLLIARGQIKDAVAYLCTSMILRPPHPESRRLLALAYASLGRLEDAAEVYRKWLAEEPDDPIARHMFAACGGSATPGRATEQFVQLVFDSFALSFDAKLAKLHYRAPQLVADELARVNGAPQKTLNALDAGCGTGLCAPLVAPFVSRLTGVDLSAQMLAKAQARGGYDELIQGELTQYLDSRPETFDLIVSADTLCYFGRLDEALQAAGAALRPDGLIIFTVERAEAEVVGASGYRLNPHGRYSHSEEYLRRLLRASGFEVLGIARAELRMESGWPVDGLVVSGRRKWGS